MSLAGKPRRSLSLVAALATVLAGCGSAASSRPASGEARVPAHWAQSTHVMRPVDLSAPRRDGNLVVGTAGRLSLWRPGQAVRPFARGPGGYSSPAGEEPYFALSSSRLGAHAGCTFGSGVLYVLRLGSHPGVSAVDARGRATGFVALATRGLLNGIAFDTTGRFGGRLLVTSTAGTKTTVFAIDCHRHVAILTRGAPKVEGGLAVAPAKFGAFGGDLIAPDENSGRIYAIAPDGSSRLVAQSGLPHGGDVGVESVAFIPRGFAPGWSALVADRLTPGNPHPGDDAILALAASALASAGVHRGDLLATTEGGAQTVAVSCTRRCRVRHVADGPPQAHVEGHIAFTPRG